MSQAARCSRPRREAEPGCRLAALGDSTQAAEWISLFARPGDLIQVARASGLVGSGGGHGLVFADTRKPGATAKKSNAEGDEPPATVFVCRPVHQHPHARLVLTPLERRQGRETPSDSASLVFAVGADGSVRGANRRFAEAVGRPLEDMIGVQYSTLLGPVSPGSGDPIAQSLADGRARSAKAGYTRASRFGQATIRPLLHARGEVRALLVRLEPVGAESCRGSRSSTARA